MCLLFFPDAEMLCQNLKYNSSFANSRGYIPQKHFAKWIQMKSYGCLNFAVGNRWLYSIKVKVIVLAAMVTEI
jgi:hypothetical protein